MSGPAAGVTHRATRDAPKDPASLDALQRLLHRRKIAMRVLVLATACCLLLGIPMSFFSRHGIALLLALFVAYFFFLLVDCGHLAAWRHRLLRAWQSGEVNLATFVGAVATVPTLPQATLAAMLHSLPILTPVQDRDLDPEARAALAAFSDWRWAEQTAAALLPSALLALLSGAAAVQLLAWAIPDARSVALLLALLAGLVLIRFGIPRWRRRRLARALTALKPEDARTMPGLASSLDWSGTTEARRQHMLQALAKLLPN